jgi:deazaflavin-dependent oxidoreductase (nitroreductase family)
MSRPAEGADREPGGQRRPSLKARLVRGFQRRALNPAVRTLAGLGLLPTHLVLETRGRRTGQPRRTPVGYGRDGDTIWIVAEYGRQADYVRNLEAEPRVRVQIGRRWWTGTAHVLDDDDARQRLRRIGHWVNAAAVRVVGTDLLTIRIDLEPVDSETARPKPA